MDKKFNYSDLFDKSNALADVIIEIDNNYKNLISCIVHSYSHDTELMDQLNTRTADNDNYIKQAREVARDFRQSALKGMS